MFAYKIEGKNKSLDFPSGLKVQLALSTYVAKEEGINVPLPITATHMGDKVPKLVVSFLINDSSTEQPVKDYLGNPLPNITMADFWDLYADRAYDYKIYAGSLSFQNPISTSDGTRVDYFVCKLVNVDLQPSRIRMLDNTTGKVITCTLNFILTGE